MSQQINQFGRDLKAKVKDNYGVFVAYFYCNNPDCCVRQVQMNIKFHGEDLPVATVCPACRKPMLDDGILDPREYDEKEDHAARVNVNVQRYKRDHAHPEHGTAWVAVPLTIYMDDSLPP